MEESHTEVFSYHLAILRELFALPMREVAAWDLTEKDVSTWDRDRRIRTPRFSCPADTHTFIAGLRCCSDNSDVSDEARYAPEIHVGDNTMGYLSTSGASVFYAPPRQHITVKFNAPPRAETYSCRLALYGWQIKEDQLRAMLPEVEAEPLRLEPRT